MSQSTESEARPAATLTDNRLLAGLSPADLARIASIAVLRGLEAGQELALAGASMDFCWFPVAGLVSIIAMDRDGREAEVGLIGAEGMVNLGALLGDNLSPLRILVQVPGEAFRVPVSTLRAMVAESAALSMRLLAYSHALSVQVAASALAYAQYPIDRRLARWLLMCDDRLNGDDIPLTHEKLSLLLGVRRAGVTIALQRLERQGAITTTRGSISIVSRDRLLSASKSGYGMPEREYQRLLIPVPVAATPRAQGRA